MSLSESPHTNSLKTNINLDEIDDAVLLHDKIVIKLRNGSTYTLPATKPEARQIYWSIKLRNRRRAFGL